MVVSGRRVGARYWMERPPDGQGRTTKRETGWDILRGAVNSTRRKNALANLSLNPNPHKPKPFLQLASNFTAKARNPKT